MSAQHLVVEEVLSTPHDFPLLNSGCSSNSLVSLPELQCLMGSLLYLREGVENSPYSHLLEPIYWQEICDVFTKDACCLMGLSVQSPLSVWSVLPSLLLLLLWWDFCCLFLLTFFCLFFVAVVCLFVLREGVFVFQASFSFFCLLFELIAVAFSPGIHHCSSSDQYIAS